MTEEKLTKKALFEIRVELPEDEVYHRVCDNWDAIAKPIDGLGDFEKLVAKIGAIKGADRFPVSPKAHLIMCADNGVVSEGVSQTDQSVTALVTGLMGEHASSIGKMALALGENSRPDFFVYDVGIASEECFPNVINEKIAKGTGNIAVEPAMREEECLQAIAVGICAVKDVKEKGYELISTGEMGIGNTTTSTAVLAALTGIPVREITGRGAGLTDAGLQKKLQVIERALACHGFAVRENGSITEKMGKSETTHDTHGEKEAVTKEQALEILQKLGGFDIAALAGVFIGGAIYRVPVIIDGVISAVAALTAERLLPGAKHYAIASHEGREQGVAKALAFLGLEPLIKGNMALGEGTGALMLLPLLDMTMSLYSSGTAFAETEIEQYERFDK